MEWAPASRVVYSVTPPGSLVVREAPPPTAQQPRLLDRVRAVIRARHYGRRTEKAYAAWIRRFILFHSKRHPTEMGAVEVTPVSELRRPGDGPAPPSPPS